MHILQIKAQVNKDKEQEFLQAIRSVVHHPEIENQKKIVVAKMDNPGLHKVEFSFHSEAEAERFKATPDYLQLIGIFEVLSDLYTISAYQPVNLENIKQ
ncbi:hypothetical protein ACFLS7_04385 [Bacteroidota bacterium]